MVKNYKRKIKPYHIQRNDAPSPLSFTPRNRRAFIACFFSFRYSSGVVLSAMSGKTLRRGLRVLTGFSWWKVSVCPDIHRKPSEKLDTAHQLPFSNGGQSRHVKVLIPRLYLCSIKRIERACFFLSGAIIGDFFCVLSPHQVM